MKRWCSKTPRDCALRGLKKVSNHCCANDATNGAKNVENYLKKEQNLSSRREPSRNDKILDFPFLRQSYYRERCWVVEGGGGVVGVGREGENFQLCNRPHRPKKEREKKTAEGEKKKKRQWWKMSVGKSLRRHGNRAARRRRRRRFLTISQSAAFSRF